jgi:hypothetical protein
MITPRRHYGDKKSFILNVYYTFDFIRQYRKEKFEDTKKVVIRSCKLEKNRQHNG